MPATPDEAGLTVHVTRELTVYVGSDGIRVEHTEQGTWAQTYDDMPFFVMPPEPPRHVLPDFGLPYGTHFTTAAQQETTTP